MASRKTYKHSYFAAEIQASFWSAQEFIVKTTQSTMQKMTLWQCKVIRLTLCATQNPELGKFRTGKQTNRKTCLEILIINCFVFNFHIFVCWNCRCTKYIQILRVNRSAHYCLWTGMTSLSKPAKKRQRFCLTIACCLWRHCLTLSSQPAVVQKEDIKRCLNPFSLWSLRSPSGGHLRWCTHFERFRRLLRLKNATLSLAMRSVR